MKVFYNESQCVSDNVSFSPSAGKPRYVVDVFRSFPQVKIVSNWAPLSKEDFYLVHEPRHVNDTLLCNKPNGFGNYLPSVASSLYWTNGSMYAAAKAALTEKVTMSPTSGFHHAGYDFNGGFCTFNGLMLAAVSLKNDKLVDTVGIVDFDMHWGNGTVDIIERFYIDYVSHIGLSDRPVYAIGDWLDSLYGELIMKFSSCNLLLYQAGADCHVNDPLGGLLTTEQMKKRDRIVFQFAKDHNIPIAWNLAGGYQEPIEKVIELHVNTLTECLQIYT